jgi:organic radical activating enzyme
MLLQDYIKSLPKLKKDLTDKSAMCATKWIHTSVYLSQNIVKNCCRVPNRHVTVQDIQLYGKDVFQNHPYEIERRQEKLNNIQHSDCKDCHACEDKNIASARLPKPFYDLHKNRFQETFDSTKPLPTELELYFNNTCDLKCVYCDSQYSSQWETENRKFNGFKKEIVDSTQFRNTFWQWFNEDVSDKILQYYILGGEPLIQEEFYEFLEKLIPIITQRPNRFNIKPELIVSTNGNTPAQYLDKWFKIIPELSKVMSIQMTISIEGIGTKAEFIRSNLNWDRFDNNLNKIANIAKEFNIRLRFNLTHSVLSITSLLELLKHLKQIKDRVGIEFELIESNVVEPAYLAPWMLTSDFSSYIDQACDWIEVDAPEWIKYNTFLKGIANSFGTGSLDNLQLFAQWEQRMIERRNLNFLDTFPEMSEWHAKVVKKPHYHIGLDRKAYI